MYLYKYNSYYLSHITQIDRILYNYLSQMCWKAENSQILIKEVKEATKITDFGNISDELIQLFEEEMIEIFFKICIKIWQTGEWLSTRSFINIPKKFQNN